LSDIDKELRNKWAALTVEDSGESSAVGLPENEENDDLEGTELHSPYSLPLSEENSDTSLLHSRFSLNIANMGLDGSNDKACHDPTHDCLQTKRKLKTIAETLYSELRKVSVESHQTRNKRFERNSVWKRTQI
jgi:hypothetical protein